MIHFDGKTKTKLKKLGVGVVYLIGSRATENARPDSDFDFGVVMQDQKKTEKGNLSLYHELSQLFSDSIPKIRVSLPFPENMIETDIVFLQTAPLYYSKEAVARGKILFEISPTFRANFEEKIMIEYGDIEPYLRAYDKVILARL